ncbi:MAG: NADH:flavin oxidoreductase [SAR324 cluster bacterium]|nr:NADH:flavin oxidoreductase [SAR324 cluster bacterium]MBL7034404.1 NADH:flavin oxidoreductase [SAR324 cluster bacterium]
MPSQPKSSLNSAKTAQSKVDTIFKPFKIQGIQCKNRILAPPTVDDHADVNGRVTPAIIKHYRSLARQGVGTIIVESAYVIKQGRSHVNQLGISEEEHLEGLEKLALGVKKEGATIGIRLNHAGGQTSEAACGEQPVGPSVMNFGRDYDISREFDSGDVEEIVLSFVHAAERAEEVGMDFIEINGTEQQLLDQCCCVKLNSRDDEYGVVKIENRLQLALEVVSAINKRESIKIPLSYYFSIFDKIEDGFKPKDLKAMLNLLEKAGVKIFHPLAVHAMNKCFENKKPLCHWTAKYTDIPLIVNGNIKSPQLLEEAATLGCADWFAMDQSIFERLQWYQFLKRKIDP